MNNKRGTHVGFVVSFVLFITFIIFIYLIVQPRLNFESKQNSLEYVRGEIINRVSGNLISASVAIGLTNPQNCIQLRDFFLKTGITDRFIVQNDSGNVLQSGKSGNDLFVERNNNLFFRVYGSEEFNVIGPIGGSCQPLNEGSQGYTLGLIKDSKDVFETKIISLIQNYNSDYETLKKDLKVPENDEFSFAFVYSNGTEISTEEKNLPKNVYVQEVPVQYINKNALREVGALRIKVW